MLGLVHRFIKINKEINQPLPAPLKRRASPVPEHLILWKVLVALDISDTKLLEHDAKNSKMVGII